MIKYLYALTSVWAWKEIFNLRQLSAISVQFLNCARRQPIWILEVFASSATHMPGCLRIFFNPLHAGV